MVVVITACKRIEDVRLATLVFDSIRVGFPTWPIVVVENRSVPEAVPIIEDAVRRVGGTLRRLPNRMSHSELIAAVLADTKGRVVFCDPDVVFWGNCEGWDFGDALIAGAYQPEASVEGIRYLERLHTSLMWIPDAEALGAELARRTGSRCYPATWTPIEMDVDGERVIADVGAQIYQALRDRAARFSEQHFDCYDHIGFSTQPHLVGLLGEHTARVTKEAHALAATNPAALKGLWRRQWPPVVSWRYYSGFVDDTFVMRAEFTDLTGGEVRVHTIVGDTFWCGMDDEDDPAPLHIRPVSDVSWSETHTILHEKGGWSDRRCAPGTRCDIDVNGKVVRGAPLWAEEEIGNGRYSGWFWAAVMYDDGAKYWLYETSAGRWAAKANGEPVEWTFDNWHESIDGRPPIMLRKRPLVECYDPIIRAKYFEGAVPFDGGIAIVEAALPPQPYDTVAMHRRLLNGNEEAVTMLEAMSKVSHLVDDIADGDLKGAPPVADLVVATLINWTRNPYYIKNRSALDPVLVVVMAMWACTDTWGKSKHRQTQMHGYVYRTAMVLMCAAFAMLTGGPMNARRAIKETHLFYRKHMEGLGNWLREQEGRRGV